MPAKPHPDGLAAAKAAAIPGCCIFCEEPIRGRADRVTCGGKDCTRAYFRAWHRDAQRRHPERYGGGFYARRARAAPPGETP